MPMNRRTFLRAAGGAAAASAASRLAGAAGAPAPGRIDCQSHLYVPELLDLMEKRRDGVRVESRGADRFVIMGDWIRKVLPGHSDVGAKVAAMDRAGIARTALSINDPGPEVFGGEGPAVARVANDWIADVCRRRPDRFFGLAVLPLQDMKAAMAEFDRCFGRLGFKGVLLYSNIAGRWPDEDWFHPLFEAVEDRGVPLLLHPALPTTAAVVKGYEMISGLGNMFDTTIALNRIILSGLLDRHPRLKVVCPHLGGTLPYVIGRVDHQTQVLKRGAGRIRRKPSEYLRQVWLDVVSPLPAAISFAHRMVGADRLLFSSDHPWVDPQLIVDCVEEAGLPAADLPKLYRSNAERLFGL
jgi:predicted TIM-barrel fold metal-dependent hydrolase